MIVAVSPYSPMLVGFGAHAAVRIKDISQLQGVRDNQVMGYALLSGCKAPATRCVIDFLREQ